MKQKALIIDIDEYKEKINGYDPENASSIHSQSAKAADKSFDQAIKSGKFSKVVLMSGGSASGKTELVHSHLFTKKAIIFDSTLSTIRGADIKIKKCLKNNLATEVIFVIPDNLQRAYLAFLNRRRKFDSSIFVKTHYGCRKTIQHIAENYNAVKITLIKSLYDAKKEKMYYNSIRYFNREDLIRYLNNIQISTKAISKIISSINAGKKTKAKKTK